MCYTIVISNYKIKNSIGSNSLSLTYQRFTLSGCKDIGIIKFERVAKPQFLCLNLSCNDIIIVEGANGDGMAVVTSLRSFDREKQKEYLIPIVIKDSGNPSMSGTSTLTVIIGDTNDNKMQPGQKDIMVYNYMVS